MEEWRNWIAVRNAKRDDGHVLPEDYKMAADKVDKLVREKMKKVGRKREENPKGKTSNLSSTNSRGAIPTKKTTYLPQGLHKDNRNAEKQRQGDYLKGTIN